MLRSRVSLVRKRGSSCPVVVEALKSDAEGRPEVEEEADSSRRMDAFSRKG